MYKYIYIYIYVSIYINISYLSLYTHVYIYIYTYIYIYIYVYNLGGISFENEGLAQKVVFRDVRFCRLPPVACECARGCVWQASSEISGIGFAQHVIKRFLGPFLTATTKCFRLHTKRRKQARPGISAEGILPLGSNKAWKHRKRAGPRIPAEGLLPLAAG